MIWSSECRSCRARLSAYVNHELSPRLRRQVAAHISRCPQCSADYQAERELQARLARELPALGRAFDRTHGWSQVETALRSPALHPIQQHRFQKRYGAAALLVAAAIALPSIWSPPPRALAVPTQQTPPISAAQADAVKRTAEPHPIAATPLPTIDEAAHDVTPPAQPNYAPSLLITSAATAPTSNEA